MAKKKQKTNQKKKKSTPKRQGVRTTSAPPGALTHLTMGVCSVSNPFCPEAIGTRWPDNSHTKSIGWGYQNQIVAIGSDATGLGAKLFSAAASNVYFTGTVAGTTVTYSSNGIAPVTAPNISRFRVVTWGLRLSSPLSKMTATGTCHVRLFSPETYGSLTSTDLVSTMADAVYDIPISRLIDEDSYILPMPLGNDARLFYPVDPTSTPAGLANVATTGWQFVQVGVSGAPASSLPVNVYVYMHIELVPPDGDASSAFAHAPPPNNPAVQNANAGVLERVGNFFEGTASKLDALVKSKAARFLGAGIGAWYGGPQGAQAGYMIADQGQRMIKNVD